MEKDVSVVKYKCSLEALGLGKEKLFLFKRCFPVLTGFRFMATVPFSKPHLHVSTNLLPFKFDSVNKKPKLWQFCLLTVWALNTRGKTRCQLSTGAENAASKCSHCAEARRLEILYTERVVALFGDRLRKLLRFCFLSVSPALAIRKEITNSFVGNCQ